MVAVNPIDKTKIDTSRGAFVDDLIRIIPLDQDEDATIMSNFDTDQLDESILNWDYTQNKTKAEIVVSMRNRSCTWKFFKSMNSWIQEHHHALDLTRYFFANL